MLRTPCRTFLLRALTAPKHFEIEKRKKKFTHSQWSKHLSEVIHPIQTRVTCCITHGVSRVIIMWQEASVKSLPALMGQWGHSWPERTVWNSTHPVRPPSHRISLNSPIIIYFASRSGPQPQFFLVFFYHFLSICSSRLSELASAENNRLQGSRQMERQSQPQSVCVCTAVGQVERWKGRISTSTTAAAFDIRAAAKHRTSLFLFPRLCLLHSVWNIMRHIQNNTFKCTQKINN